MRLAEFPFLILCLLLSLSCTTGSGPMLRPGMTQEEVRGLLGKPNRVEQEGLAEDWFYQAVERRRMVTSESNGSLPGETVHERDLRHSLEGVRNSASISTETVTRERTLHFGEDGRLVAKEPFRLLPGE